MSVAAENVIGGILVGGRDAYWLVADMLRPEDFPTPRLASLYRLCGDIAQSDADLDVVTVGEEAERQGIIPLADLIGWRHPRRRRRTSVGGPRRSKKPRWIGGSGRSAPRARRRATVRR
jgi:Replicative DNA helicase